MGSTYEKQILKAPDFLHSNTKQGDSSVWKSIVKCKDLIRQGIRWSVGVGQDILFWFDNWVDNRALLDIMSLDEHMISNPAAKVCDFMHNKQWNVSMLAQTINNPIIVQKIIGIPIPFNEVQDSFCWGLSTSGAFSTKSATWLTQGSYSLEDPPWPFRWIWRIDTMPKIKIFIWQMCLNALPVRGLLFRRGGYVDPQCPLCFDDIESIQHLFKECAHTQPV